MKSPLIEFAYNNSVYNTINISPFFAIYSFYFNVSSSIKDDRPKREVPIAREKVENFESENKKLAERWRRAIEF
jgi:hypothetical protein